MSDSHTPSAPSKTPVSTRELAALARTVHDEFAIIPGSTCAALSRRARRLARNVETPPRASASRLLWIDEVYQALSSSLTVAARLRKNTRPRSLVRTIIANCTSPSPAAAQSKDLQTVRSISRTIAEWLSAFTAMNQLPDNDLALDLAELSDASAEVTVIPALPTRYVPIHILHFDELKTCLLRIAAAESETGLVCISGPVGVGKSLLTNALIHDPTVAQAFPDGIAWVQLGPAVSNALFVRDIALVFGTILNDLAAHEARRVSDLESLLAVAHKHAFYESRSLIIVDSVCDDEVSKERLAAIADMLGADRVSHHAAVIFTTNQDPSFVCSRRAVVFPLTPVAPLGDDARAVFDSWASLIPLDPNYHNSFRGHIIQACGGLPMALAISGAALRKTNFDWDGQASALDASAVGGLFVGCDGESASFLLLHWMVRRRPRSFADRLRAMSILPPGTWVPASTLARLWNVDDATARATIKRMERLGLSSSETRNVSEIGLRLHSIVYEYCVQLATVTLEKEPEDISSRTTGAHRGLVEEYAKFASLPIADTSSRCRSWWLLANDEYVSNFLAWHLVKSGLASELKYLLCDFRWISKRFTTAGPCGLRADFDTLLSFVTQGPDWESLSVLASVVGNMHSAIQSESQLAFQLCSQLGSDAFKRDKVARRMITSIEHHAKRPWFRPLQDRTRGDEAQNSKNMLPFKSALVRKITGAGAGLVPVAVSLDQDGEMSVWSLVHGEWGRILRPLGNGYSHSVAIVIPDGYVVSGATDGVLRLWSLQTGEYLKRFKGRSCAVTALATARISSSRKRNVSSRLVVASGSSDGSVFVFDMDADDGWQREYFGHMDEVTAICVLPYQRRVASGSFDGFAYIWSIDSGKRTPLNGHKDRISQFAALNSGEKLASSCHGGHVYVWSSASGALLWSKDVGYEFLSSASLERFANLNAEGVRTALKAARVSDLDRFPYFCARGIPSDELVIVNAVGCHSAMASGVFEAPITAVTEVAVRDRLGNDMVVVLVGLETGSVIILEVVTCFVAYAKSEKSSSPRAISNCL